MHPTSVSLMESLPLESGGAAPHWWRRLDGEDLISLQPLRRLRHEPFALPSDEAQPAQRDRAVDWFDCRTLAQYLVASRYFFHPASRRPISRHECTALDEHLLRHKLTTKQLPRGAVAAAFDRAQAEASQRLADEDPVRREEMAHRTAQELMRSLFEPARADADAARDAAARGARDGTPEVTRSGEGLRAAARPTAAVSSEGNLTVIDDDLFPRGVNPRAAGEWARGAAREVSPFPSLPAPSTRRAPLQMPRPSPHVPRQPSAGACAEAVAAPAPADDDGAAARREALRAAFGRSDAEGSTFAASSAKAFTAETLALARESPDLVAQLERRLDAFVAGAARREALEPMTRKQRALVHELARHYGIATASYDPEPRRHVDLFRSERTDWPSLRLSDACKVPVASSDSCASAAGGSASHDSASYRSSAAHAGELVLELTQATHQSHTPIFTHLSHPIFPHWSHPISPPFVTRHSPTPNAGRVRRGGACAHPVVFGW